MTGPRTRAFRRSGSLLTAAIFAAAAILAGQSPPAPQTALPQIQQPQPPVIRSGADLVRVDVTVLDEKGQPVTTLTEDDFEVLEDDVPQPVRSFRFVALDGNPDDGDETSLPIRSPQHAAAEAARDDVRMFLIFWDEYHINRMLSAVAAKEHLAKFVRTAFGPTDLVAFMDPLTPTDAVRFTRDRHQLAEAVRTLRGRSGEYTPVRSVLEEAHLQSREGPERLRSQVTMTALKSAAVLLGSLKQGRKSIIFISEGMRGLGRDEPLMMGDLIRTASDSNTAIYTLNPLGLTTYRLRSFDMLRALAMGTGAEAFTTNDFDRALRRVIAQAGGYYLLGYTPEQLAFDGRFHKIRVRVKRPGLTVRARAGYWAPTVLEMQRAERQRSDSLPPRVAAAFAELTPGTARRSVDVWIGASVAADGRPQVRLAWAPRAAEPGETVDEIAGASAIATGAGGAVAFDGAVDRDGTVFPAAPGPMQVTFAARDASGDIVDRHERTIEVPDPAAATLWISSPIVIRASTPLELKQARSDPDAPPAAEREFTRADRLLIRFGVHGTDAGQAAITARLLNGRAAALTALATAARGGGYEIDLLLSSIARGDYAVAIEARHGDRRTEIYVPLRIVR